MLEGCKSTDLGGSELEHLALVRSQQDEDKSSSNQSGIYPVAGRCETMVRRGAGGKDRVQRFPQPKADVFLV